MAHVLNASSIPASAISGERLAPRARALSVLGAGATLGALALAVTGAALGAVALVAATVALGAAAGAVGLVKACFLATGAAALAAGEVAELAGLAPLAGAAGFLAVMGILSAGGQATRSVPPAALRRAQGC